jgi:Domain of unknown function (DUF4123)/FHA domain
VDAAPSAAQADPRDVLQPALRHVIVEVRGGPPGARRVVVAPGRHLRIGRTSLADFEVPGDEAMSQEHWELVWDGAICEVRDLGSAGGTFVGGERRERAEVRSGAWIRAGKTDFSVYLEHVDPPGHPVASAADGSPERSARKEYALSVLAAAARGAPLFAVLDAARSDAVLRLLRTSVDDFVSLWDGLRSETEEDGAPYLVRFAPGSRLLPRLVGHGWGESWGVFLATHAPLAEVRAHLRKLLVVTREADHRPMYFRFYDPRVLGSFLPIATVRQHGLVFGPVQRFFAEGPDGDGVLSWSP